MWLIGAGIMVAGLLSMVFAGIAIGLAVIAGGAAIAAASCYHEQQAEQKAESWRKNYPSYKY